MERPLEIPNPIKLGFRLAEVSSEPGPICYQGNQLQPIPLQEIFADDLERTLWLAIKWKHLTWQLFNHQIRKASARIRAHPPADPRALHYAIEGMTGRHVDDQTKAGPDRFCEELFRYVINVLDGGENVLRYEEPPEPRSEEKTACL